MKTCLWLKRRRAGVSRNREGNPAKPGQLGVSHTHIGQPLQRCLTHCIRDRSYGPPGIFVLPLNRLTGSQLPGRTHPPFAVKTVGRLLCREVDQSDCRKQHCSSSGNHLTRGRGEPHYVCVSEGENLAGLGGIHNTWSHCFYDLPW